MKKLLLENAKLQNGVYYLSNTKNEFEETYIEVRKKEKRVYSDLEVAQLPEITSSHPHYNEWQLRKISCIRFIKYLDLYSSKINILDIGCGNGWFAAAMAQKENSDVYGLDINQTELEQAARLFSSDNLSFIYGDLFDNILPDKNFALITLNASVQYFKDVNTLLNKLIHLLTDGGEIHILDSPFYKTHEIEAARKRTAMYYESIGHLNMSSFYFHHSINDLNKYKFSVMFSPQTFLSKFRKVFKGKESPFPWIKIVH